MEKVTKTWHIFIIGLLTGIIAGGVIVWLEMKDANRNFLSQILYELNTLKLEKRIAADELQKEKTAEGKNIKTETRQVKKIKSDTLLTVKTVEDTVSSKADTMNLVSMLPPDTIEKDTALPEEKDMVVKKDRLIFSSRKKLKILDETINDNHQDSLMEEVSGVHKEGEIRDYTIEFWESPINYKGYKMGNKKIIVFGLGNEFENVELYRIEKEIVLRHYDTAYQLETTYNFAPFKKVTDKVILMKLAGMEK